MVSRSDVLLDSHAQLIADFWSWIAVISRDDEAFRDFDVLAWDLADGALVPALVGMPKGARSDGRMTWPQRQLMVELTVQMTSLRSLRWRVDEQRVMPVDADWRERLEEDYPYNFHYDMSVGDGWHDLIHATIACSGLPLPEFEQVKSKYGGLRAYYRGSATSRAEAVVTASEYISECVCERCGRPGRVRNLAWMGTLCDEHAAEQGTKDGF